MLTELPAGSPSATPDAAESRSYLFAYETGRQCGSIDKVLSGKIDLAFTHLLAGPPRSHPLAVSESLTFDDLKDACFICNPATANGTLRSAQGLGSQGRRAAQPGLTPTATSLVV